MHMRRSRAIPLIAAAALASMAAPAPGQSIPDKLRIAGPLTEDMVNVYYGIQHGLFQRVGIDVELVATSNGAAATDAVVAGTYEIAKTAVTSILPAHLRGIPLTMVAPQTIYTPKNPFALLQVLPDAPYKTGADFNGKTIGVPGLNSLNQLSMRAWVDKNGGDWKSLKFVEVPNSALVAALTQKRIDAAVLASPQLDDSIQEGSTKTLADAYAAVAPRFFVAAFMALTDWTSKHADVLRRFNRALATATNYVNTHLPDTAPLVTELTKMTLDVYKMHRTINGTRLDVALFQPVIDAAAKYDLISRAFPAKEIVWSS
jgi:NitT/TauT family transport system substrate-binding protein